MLILNPLHLINHFQRVVLGHIEKGIGPIGMTSSELAKEMRTNLEVSFVAQNS